MGQRNLPNLNQQMQALTADASNTFGGLGVTWSQRPSQATYTTASTITSTGVNT